MITFVALQSHINIIRSRHKQSIFFAFQLLEQAMYRVAAAAAAAAAEIRHSSP
jgi:hypothetical protein